MTSCFGSAAAYQEESCASGVSVAQRPLHNCRSNGAGGSPACPGVVPFSLARNTQTSTWGTSIWLRPPETVVSNSTEGASTKHFSGKRPAAPKATASRLGVRRSSSATLESTRTGLATGSGGLDESLTFTQLQSASLEAHSPDQAYRRGRRRRNSSTPKWAPGDRRLPGSRTRRRASAVETASILQHKEYEVDSGSPEESGIFWKRSRRRWGSLADGGTRYTPVRGGGRSRDLCQTRQAREPAVSSPTSAQNEEATARRRVLLEERTSSGDAEDYCGSSFVGVEEAAKHHRTAGAPASTVASFSASTHRGRQRDRLGASSSIQQRAQPSISVKPCIWIAPQFVVTSRAAGGRAAEAVTRLVESSSGGGPGAKPEAGQVSTGSLVQTPPKAFIDGISSSEGAPEGMLSVNVIADTSGDRWPSNSSSVTLAGKAFWRTRWYQEHRIALRFFAKRFVLIFCYFVVADVFMSVLSVISDMIYEHHPQPKLRDRFHDWVLGGSPPPGLAQIVTDCLTVSLVIVTLIRHFFFVQVPLNLMIIFRYFFLMATTYWLRGVAIFLTTMPASTPNCKVKPVNSARDFVESVFLASTFRMPLCTDLVISGHTLSTCLCVATWLFYNNCNKDEAERQKALFYILLRWVRSRRRSVGSQGQRDWCSVAAGADSPAQHQRSSRQPLPDQCSSCRKGRKKVVGEVANGSERCLGAVAAGTSGWLSEEKLLTAPDAELVPTATAGYPHKQAAKTQRDDENGTRHEAVVGGGQVSQNTPEHMKGVRAQDGTWPSVQLELLSAADCKGELLCAEDEAEEYAGAESESMNGRILDAEGRPPSAVVSRVLLRDDAIVGAAAVAAETPVAGTGAAAGHVFHLSEVSAGAPFPAARNEGPTLSVSESAASSFSGAPLGATAACAAVPFVACDEGEAPSSAASATLRAAFGGADVVEENERKISTQSQEMEDFFRAEVNRAAAGDATKQQLPSTATEDHQRSSSEVLATAGERGSTGTRCSTEDRMPPTDRRSGREEAPRDTETESSFREARLTFHRPSALAQEQPAFSGRCAFTETDQKRILAGTKPAGGMGGAAAGSASGLAASTLRGSAAAKSEAEKSPDDGGSASQCTPGAGSCSSSEEDGGMRALLPAHQSRRHPREKNSTLQFGCCSVPPGLSSFFTVANDSAAVPQDDACARSCAHVHDAAAAREEEAAQASGGRVENTYHEASAEDAEEELERMGQYDKRRAARVKKKVGVSGAVAARGSEAGGVVLFFRSCLTGIGRRLLTLLSWACAWNLLGTWCLLQAAANIIIIDASFCHYTVDIFFGMMFSLGCFTLYHVIVCLLWAARPEDDVGTAEAKLAYYTVVFLPSAKRLRNRSSCRCRVKDKGDTICTSRSSCLAPAGARELPRSSSLCRRRGARGTPATRLALMDAIGEEQAATRSARRSVLDTSERPNSPAERAVEGGGRRVMGVSSGGDLSERDNWEDLTRADRRMCVTCVGDSNAIASAVMKEMEDTARGTENGGRTTLPGNRGTLVSSVATLAEPYSGTADTVVHGASREAGVECSRGTSVGDALAEVEESREGSRSRSDGEQLHVIALPQQCRKEEGAHLACIQQGIRGVVPDGDALLEAAADQLKTPVETPVTAPGGVGLPPLLRADGGKEAGKGVEEFQSFLADSSMYAGKCNSRSCTSTGVRDTGTRATSGPAQPRALRKSKKRIVTSKDIVAKGMRARRHRVLHVSEKVSVGEPRVDVAADVAVSILRFPLVRCAAYFIARLEGLELP